MVTWHKVVSPHYNSRFGGASRKAPMEPDVIPGSWSFLVLFDNRQQGSLQELLPIKLVPLETCPSSLNNVYHIGWLAGKNPLSIITAGASTHRWSCGQRMGEESRCHSTSWSCPSDWWKELCGAGFQRRKENVKHLNTNCHWQQASPLNWNDQPGIY